VAMGANILVMGVIPALVGYGLYRLVSGRGRRMALLGAGVAALLSVVAAALLTALFLGFSNTVSFAIVVPVMLGIHTLIGLGEALITVGALSFIRAARPQLLERSATAGGRGWIAGGLAVTLLVLLLSPLASGFPDGLEWVAGETGFLASAQDPPYELLPDYTIPLSGEAALSTVAAGVLGALLAAVAALLAAGARRRRAGEQSH